MRFKWLLLETLAVAGCFSPTDRVEKMIHGKIKIVGVCLYPDWDSWNSENYANALVIQEKDLLDDLEGMRRATVEFLAAKKKRNPNIPREDSYLFDGVFFWCDMVLENRGRIMYKLSYDKITGAPLFFRDNESDILFDHEMHFIKGSPLFRLVPFSWTVS